MEQVIGRGERRFVAEATSGAVEEQVRHAVSPRQRVLGSLLKHNRCVHQRLSGKVTRQRRYDEAIERAIEVRPVSELGRQLRHGQPGVCGSNAAAAEEFQHHAPLPQSRRHCFDKDCLRQSASVRRTATKITNKIEDKSIERSELQRCLRLNDAVRLICCGAFRWQVAQGMHSHVAKATHDGTNRTPRKRTKAVVLNLYRLQQVHRTTTITY